MAIEIVDFPSYKMVIFHSFLYVYQRVIPQISEQVVGGSNSDGSFAKKKNAGRIMKNWLTSSWWENLELILQIRFRPPICNRVTHGSGI